MYKDRLLILNIAIEDEDHEPSELGIDNLFRHFAWFYKFGGGDYPANPSNSIFYICKIGTVFSRKKGRGLVEINYRFCFSIICSFCSSDFTYLTIADCGKN